MFSPNRLSSLVLAPLALSTSVLLGACGDSSGESPETGNNSDPVPMTGSDTNPGTTMDPTGSATTNNPQATTTGVATTGDSTAGEETIGPPIFDLGVPDMPNGDPECTKVDFLFIIDNSSSMGAYQTNLVNNFPGFINGIQGVLDNTDSYHVGVVTTDPYTFNVAGCNDISSLVVQTGGFNSSNMVCGPFADGENYMTENDDLEDAFSCAASVGTAGSGNEQPMLALIEAVQGVEAGPGGCNEGFLRDDSLLVVVNIGDEFDNSPGTPMTWYDDVVAARSGIPENVVMVSIIDGPAATAACGGFGASADRAEFTALWGDNGFEVPICIADYAPAFEEAISIIDVACENFIPPQG